MLLTKLLQKDYTKNSDGYQLKLPLNLETIIPDNDSVRLLSQFVEAMDLTDLYSTYERINSVSPRTLLKIVLYSYMNGDYSSRSMELNCKRDINFMFHFLKGKSKENVLYAPCKGKVVPLSEVPDPTFSEKILGDGFAVIPSEGKIYAPTDGEIAMVFDTLHAITLTSSSGAEILIHIGLDTVTLKGAPFTAHVAAGDQVKKGDLLMDVDLDKITGAGLNTVTPVLICNTDDYEKISLKKEGEVSLDEAVLSIS